MFANLKYVIIYIYFTHTHTHTHIYIYIYIYIKYEHIKMEGYFSLIILLFKHDV